MARRRKRYKDKMRQQHRQRHTQRKALPATTTPVRVVAKTEAKSYSYARNCDHWQDPFELRPGVSVYLSAYFDRPFEKGVEKARRSFVPGLGVYFDGTWSRDKMLVSPGLNIPGVEIDSDTEHTILFPWTDRAAPRRMRDFCQLVEWIVKAAETGVRVELGCIGAHGRTGTALACILVHEGMLPGKAVEVVRNRHCSQAIESQEQVYFVRQYARNTQDFTVSQYDADDPVFRHEVGLTLNGYTSQYGGETTTSKYGNTSGHGYTPGHDYERSAATKDWWERGDPKTDDSKGMDDYDYQTWQRLNDEAAIKAEVERVEKDDAWEGSASQIRTADVDLECSFAPCAYPFECDPKEGDCFRGRIAESIAQEARQGTLLDDEDVARRDSDLNRDLTERGFVCLSDGVWVHRDARGVVQLSDGKWVREQSVKTIETERV